jgi:BirA family biotin operon repressor/biotin-[acetyl-CoA-carboxylase] ligase
MPDPLHLPQLRAGLTGTRFTQLQHFATVDSTNTQMLAAAAAGAPEGLVYLADEQTAGRGRGGHAWHSAPGEGLYLSALVRPYLPLRDALLLSLATGLAAWQAVHQSTTLALDLHWPNDLYISEKKAGGILVETGVEPGADPLLRYAVIGIGINLQQRSFPAELAAVATSLALAGAGHLSRTALALALLRALDLELTQLEADASAAPLLARFAEHSSWVRGKHVHVPEQGGYSGVTAGLNAHGFLLVETGGGELRTVLSGGVRALAAGL